jgi:hypothetical protein
MQQYAHGTSAICKMKHFINLLNKPLKSIDSIVSKKATVPLIPQIH